MKGFILNAKTSQSGIDQSEVMLFPPEQSENFSRAIENAAVTKKKNYATIM